MCPCIDFDANTLAGSLEIGILFVKFLKVFNCLYRLREKGLFDPGKHISY